jgi:predicted DNA-binding transcriptional regulator YafY
MGDHQVTESNVIPGGWQVLSRLLGLRLIARLRNGLTSEPELLDKLILALLTESRCRRAAVSLSPYAELRGGARRIASLLVSFRAGGALEMVWHLFTWGDQVKILKPKRLGAMLRTQIQMLLRHHA